MEEWPGSLFATTNAIWPTKTSPDGNKGHFTCPPFLIIIKNSVSGICVTKKNQELNSHSKFPFSILKNQAVVENQAKLSSVFSRCQQKAHSASWMELNVTNCTDDFLCVPHQCTKGTLTKLPAWSTALLQKARCHEELLFVRLVAANSCCHAAVFVCPVVSVYLSCFMAF